MIRLAALITVFSFACVTPAASADSHHSLSLACQGVTVRAPAGWHGRIQTGAGGYFTLTLATFPLVSEADAVDEQSSKRMSPRDVLVLLIAYGPGEVSNPVFQTRTRLPLTVQAMRVYDQFEHVAHGHRLARRTFVALGSAYDAQVQFARTITPSLRAKANGVLQVIRFSPAPRYAPSGPTRC